MWIQVRLVIQVHEGVQGGEEVQVYVQYEVVHLVQLLLDGEKLVRPVQPVPGLVQPQDDQFNVPDTV